MSIMKEHPIEKGIFVTKEGEVYTTRKNSGGTPESPKLLTGTITQPDGYRVYSFSSGKRKGHRLVAETYLPNPDNLPDINHLDENKLNNHVDNLVWSTEKENTQYSICHYVYVIEHISTGDMYETISLNEFISEHGLTTNLYKTEQGTIKQSGGYRIVKKYNRSAP